MLRRMSRPAPAVPSPWWRRPLRWFANACLGVLVAWAVLSIAYAPGSVAPLRWCIALALLAFSIWALWRTRRWWPLPVVALLLLAAICSRYLFHPSQEREWRADVAVL